MKKYTIACLCKMYNDLKKGHLERFVQYIKPLVNELVVYDGGSTDGSYEYMLHHTPYVIRGNKKDLADRQKYRQALLNEALKLRPDFILWLDADEVLTSNAAEKLQGLCAYCVRNQMPGLSWQEIILWRSSTWQRVDGLFGSRWTPRLWRVAPGMAIDDTPTTERNTEIKVLHYGFSTEILLAQRGYEILESFIGEEGLQVEKVPPELVPDDLWTDDERPRPLPFEESLDFIERYREEVFRPSFSIICPISKSVDWLKFVYKQALKYTDMTDKEFFFVANNTDDKVLRYLRDNYIPFYILENAPAQKKEWHTGSVYRAYNFGARQARGEFLVFIHSDMAFTPMWLDNLIKAYNGSNCLVSRLVESGRSPAEQYGIEKDFGWDPVSFRESEFRDYASGVAVSEVADGGQSAPLLIRKSHFEMVGGYSESGNREFSGAACDTLRRKLAARGIVQQTVFNSIVYHFQSRETDGPETRPSLSDKTRAVVYSVFSAGTNKNSDRFTEKKNDYVSSIIITTFQRPHLLKWGLYSLARQNIPFRFETIVVNDGVQDETEGICQEYRERLNLKYIFSGRRNLNGELRWRVPGYAVNIGARHSSGRVLIITCSEMFHLNDTIAKLTYPLLDNGYLLGIPAGKDDRDGSFLESLQNNGGEYDINLYNSCSELNVYLPFLMSVSREHFLAIGGYDEEFTGIAYDDNDLVQRLRMYGCNYCQTDAKTIHLYHPRYWPGRDTDPEFQFNKNLYLLRKGKIIRNENREWGKL